MRDDVIIFIFLFILPMVASIPIGAALDKLEKRIRERRRKQRGKF